MQHPAKCLTCISEKYILVDGENKEESYVYLTVVTVFVGGSVILIGDGDGSFAYLWKVFTVEAIKC